MVSWTKFEGKLFSDPKCSGPLLQTLPLKMPVFVAVSEVAESSTPPQTGWDASLSHRNLQNPFKSRTHLLTL